MTHTISRCNILPCLQLEGPLACAKATAELMRTVVTRRGHSTSQALLDELANFGAQLQAAKPMGMPLTMTHSSCGAPVLGLSCSKLVLRRSCHDETYLPCLVVLK